ncbi:hypothetical protein C4D60_Mb03t20290 [Musa balbisiana]|uniref:Uncharacterized protein n=1 Tax=Musa balbisiana TaxID=52838 RepID=A0A4S8JBB3_MUSBA|nr:hypothetical protein C4D60_Mb03t20290 [Musa balbisiana]
MKYCEIDIAYILSEGDGQRKFSKSKQLYKLSNGQKIGSSESSSLLLTLSSSPTEVRELELDDRIRTCRMIVQEDNFAKESSDNVEDKTKFFGSGMPYHSR